MPALRAKALVWILRPDGRGGAQVLLLERPGRRGGGLHPVTGKAEQGEAPLAAAAREVEEETGLKGALTDLRFRHEYSGGRGRFVEYAFLLVVEAGARVVISDEHVAAQWVAPEEAAAPLEWEAHKASLALALKQWEAHPGAAGRQRGS
jgi:dATP pyrophosphohydrolase